MRIPYETLKSTLQEIISRTVSEKQLTLFVQFSRAIVQSYLGSIHQSIAQLSAKQGLSATDLAYDCLAEAFARDEKNAFPLLNNFVASLDSEIDETPDLEIFLAFKGFLTKIARAQLARLFALQDPAGAHINRNLRDYIRTSKRFTVRKDFRGPVVYPSDCEELDYLPAYPMDELERDILLAVRPGEDIPHLMCSVGKVLMQQTSYRRSVPLIALVQILRKVYQPDELDPVSTTQTIPFEGLSEFELDRIRHQVELALKEKILLTYLARGKLDRREAEGIFNALSNLIGDWYDGDAGTSSLYDHLKRHVSLTQQEYESGYRAKMEYLVKFARDEFASRLTTEI